MRRGREKGIHGGCATGDVGGGERGGHTKGEDQRGGGLTASEGGGDGGSLGEEDQASGKARVGDQVASFAVGGGASANDTCLGVRDT